MFTRWSTGWDTDKSGSLDEEKLGAGLNAVLTHPNFGGMGGMGGGLDIKGVELDPLPMADDADKPLISKRLAVTSLRARYLTYVRDSAAPTC